MYLHPDDLPPDGPCIVRVARAFSSPTVYFGPFPNYNAAFSWVRDKKLNGVIVYLEAPDVDTAAGARVWS